MAGQTIPRSGQIAEGYQGSYDEWYERVVSDLINNYATGKGGEGGYASGAGKPNPNDYGNNTVSWQTEMYWENYVSQAGSRDPWILENYGAPPTNRATYVTDPNSASALTRAQQEGANYRAELAESGATERARLNAETDLAIAGMQAAASAASDASRERVAAMQEAGATERVRMQIQGDWAIATLNDATRRYIAEGDWGVQKWVTTENNRASMERLQAELGFRREALAQDAVAEKNRHQEALSSLALQIAQYDAELAAQPRNWLAYAAWLRVRDIPINGLSMAMAAQEVPENQLSAAETFAATGSGLAGVQQAQAQTAATGSPEPQSVVSGMDGGNGLNPMQAPISAQGLENIAPDELARTLLGYNPLAATQNQASTENLQAISDSLNMQGKAATFGAYGGPTTNALGVEVSQPTGSQVDYRKFKRLLPSQQQMKVGEAESIGRYAPDWLGELENSRPRGGATGAASYG